MLLPAVTQSCAGCSAGCDSEFGAVAARWPHAVAQSYARCWVLLHGGCGSELRRVLLLGASVSCEGAAAVTRTLVQVY